MRGLTFWPEGTGRSASSGSVTVVGSFAAHGKPTGGQNILFGFDNLSAKNKAVKTTRHRFSCLGASVSCRSTFQPQSSDPLWEPDCNHVLDFRRLGAPDGPRFSVWGGGHRQEKPRTGRGFVTPPCCRKGNREVRIPPSGLNLSRARRRR